MFRFSHRHRGYSSTDFLFGYDFKAKIWKFHAGHFFRKNIKITEKSGKTNFREEPRPDLIFDTMGATLKPRFLRT